MKKKAQTSLLDFLMDHLGPNFVVMRKQTPSVDPQAANALFGVWKDTKNHVGGKLYKKPTTLSRMELEAISKEGLARDIGDKLEVTSKGSEVIRTMILGDDRSAWEEDGKTKDFITAEAYTKTRSLKKIGKKNEASWWANQKIAGNENDKH